MTPTSIKDQLDLFGGDQKSAVQQAAPKVPAFQPCAWCREQYLTDHQVAARFGTSRATVWRWIKRIPSFPKPIKLSPGTSRWKLSDLVRYESKVTLESAAPNSTKAASVLE